MWLYKRGGCRITTIFATIGYTLNSIIFLTCGYIEVISRASSLETIITIVLFAISYKDFCP